MNIISRNTSTGSSDPNLGLSTVTADDCKAHVSECLRLRNTGKISNRRATILIAMMISWIELANQIENYEAILKQEAGDRGAR